MPSLGTDMEDGTLVEWLVAPGDSVARGDIVAVVETEKGAIEIEIFDAGAIRQLVFDVGDLVPVDTVLATYQQDGEETVSDLTKEQAAPRATVQAALISPAPRPSAPVTPKPVAAVAGRLRVSPAARKHAADLSLDLTTITGTGRGGAITLEDVEQAAAQPPVPGPVPAVPSPAAPGPTGPSLAGLSPMRRAIANAMARSKREIPHYYLAATIDMTSALDWLEAENQARPVTERMLYAALLIKAVAKALQKTPELNGIWTAEGYQQSADVHAGMAISLREGGLIAPALRDTDKKDVSTLMTEFRDLVKRARAGGLRSSELSDPTITVTSLGEQGIETVFPIIYPPQAAIVGFGAVVERPWSVDGQIVSRRVITASLAADHRVSDGHRGGLFLAALDRLLQEPGAL